MNKVIRHTLATGLLSASMCFQAMAEEQAVLLITAQEAGIQRVEIQDVLDQGIDLTGLNPNKLKLLHRGNVVPIDVEHSGSLLDANSAIEFISTAENGFYQRGAVYALVLGDGGVQSERLSTPLDASQLPQTHYRHREFFAPNSDYSFGAPGNDPWYAQRLLTTGAPVHSDLEVPVSALHLNNEAAELEVVIWGGTDLPQSPDHAVTLDFNGTQLGRDVFDGVQLRQLNYSLPLNQLHAGDNQIGLSLNNDNGVSVDLIHVESWQLSYPRSHQMIDGALTYDSGDVPISGGGNDVIFAHGFDQAEADKLSANAALLFTLNNASNGVYRIYQQGINGQLSRQDFMQLDGGCLPVNTSDCTLSFMGAPNARIHVARVDTLKQPALSLPPVLQDIHSGSAQYLIIAHPDFINADLQRLVNLRNLQRTVDVIDVEQVYAQYSHYTRDAAAIHAYIRDAAALRSTDHVLLVGGDTYDYHNILGANSISHLPTLYAATDDLIQYAPVDAKYADIDGDDVPDLALGRLPVRNDQDLESLVDKILDYENRDYDGTALFAADGFDSAQNYSFEQDAESMIQLLPEAWQQNIGESRKAFIDVDGLGQARQKIIHAINDGVSLTNFVGHSGPNDWSFSRLFSNHNASALLNAQRPTIVSQWGCWNTYFVSPTENTLAHAFMLNRQGGAAAVLGASTLTQANSERALASEFLSRFTAQDLTLGEAVLLGKQALATQHPEMRDVILGWNILGDPALK